MADTLNSWKQLFKAKQGFEQLNEVVVGPQGGAAISLREAVVVTEGMSCTVTAKDRDKVTINAEVCCPPIEFGIIMGEQDINRPGVTREDWGRVIWTTNSPTTSRLTWGPAGTPTAFLVTGSSVESKQHELFFQGLNIGSRYEFIVGGCRAFCSDCASSPIYAFSVGELTEIFINATFSLTPTLSLKVCSSTTLAEVIARDSLTSGGQAGTTQPINLTLFTNSLTLSAVTTSHLLQTTHMFTSVGFTTVP